MRTQRKTKLALTAICAAWAIFCVGAGCVGSSDANRSNPQSSAGKRKFPLNTLKTANLTVNGKTIRAWLAISDEQHMEGLMNVPENEIADDQGMLFVFSDEQPRGFWMKNTITSLDIAFARANGQIVKTWTMPPLTLNTFPSIEPAMFALEMKAGAFQRLGIKEGDTLVIPEEVLKMAP